MRDYPTSSRRSYIITLIRERQEEQRRGSYNGSRSQSGARVALKMEEGHELRNARNL